MKTRKFLIIYIMLIMSLASVSQAAACGGDGELKCSGEYPCDLWRTINLNYPDYCIACGGDGYFKCTGENTPSACREFRTINLNYPNYCIACGNVGQARCPESSISDPCRPGLELAANGTCVTSCGGDGELKCNGENPCDEWRTVNLNYPDYCIACGGDGYFKCTGENTPYPCREWRTNNTMYPDYCIACGGPGQLACDYSLSSPGLCRDETSEISAEGRCEPCGDAGQPQCAEMGTTNTATVEGDLLEVPKQTPGEPVWGFVDAHEHQFANEAYGGAMFWGKPFSAGGINKALASCDYTWDFKTKYSNPLYALDFLAFTWTGATLDGRGFPVHGTNWATAIPFHPVPTQALFGLTVNMATADHYYDSEAVEFLFSGWPELANILQWNLIPHMHHVSGADNFYLHSDEDHGWPHYLDGGHQQMYYKWLERSYQAGLRLLVNMPVNNEELCKLSVQREGYSCDDMWAAYKQIDSIKALERFVDLEDDGIINQTGWYRIAYSPQQAREIIEDGAMAVIISVEVDSLFGCKPGTENTFCTEEYIDEQIDKLYRAGVRHLFPVHLFDNAFSGAAYYSDIFSVANSFNTGDIFQPKDCIDDEEGYSYRFETWSSIVNLLYAPAASLYGADFDILTNSFSMLDPNRGADCNSKGLTDRGDYILKALMNKGMLIDIDHFSHSAMLDVLKIFDVEKYPPVSSHTVVYPDVNTPLSVAEKDEGARSELGVSRSQAKKILELGGHITINPSRPNHFEGWEGGTTKQFVYGIHKQFKSIGNLPYYEKRALGYNDIIALIDEVYLENNDKGLSPQSVRWFDRAYPHISFVGDFGAFVNQPEPRFSNDAGNLEPKCAPDSLLETLPEECTQSIVDVDGTPLHVSLNCPASALDLFLPQNCLVEAQDDGTISLKVYPPLKYPFDGFEPVDKNNPDGPKIGKFYEQKTGTRTFDFNTDGLAHYGLVPDMLADARDNYGADLKPFFNSAEAFIRLWERVYVPDANSNDSDGDGIGDDMDVCPGHDDNLDADGDTIPDDCDICVYDPENDVDDDGVCGDVDVCPGHDDNLDTDGDTIPDGCDACPGYDDNLDTDGDTIPDGCDICPSDPANDVDGDGVCGDVDNCPVTSNKDQANHDSDSMGDACDPDDDNDGIPDVSDQCPYEDATGLDADNDGCIDTFAGAVGFIEDLVDSGLLNANLNNPLTSKIKNARKSVEKGNICAAVNQIEAYVNQVEGMRGKKISIEVADQLIQYCNNLITQLRTDLSDGEICK